MRRFGLGLTFAAGAAARVMARVYGIGALFEEDATITTASSSAACRREVTFLLSQDLLPSIDSECLAQPPLALGWSVLTRLLPSSWTVEAEWMLVLLADLACAGLVLCATGRPAPQDRRGMRAAACLAILLSPWCIAGSAVGSAACLPTLAVLCAAHCAARGRAVTAAASLALATGLSLDSLWLLFPLVSVCCAASASGGSASGGSASGGSASSGLMVSGSAWHVCGVYGCWVCGLALVLLASDDAASEWLSRMLSFHAHGAPLHGAPDVGLWWYLLALAFLPSRPTFVAAMHLLPRLCIPCLAVTFAADNAPPEHVRTDAPSDAPSDAPEGAPSDAPSDASPRPCSPSSAWRPPSARRQGSGPVVWAPPPQLVFALCALVLTLTKRQVALGEASVCVAYVASQLDGPLAASCRHLELAAVLTSAGALSVSPLITAWREQRQLNANFAYAAAAAAAGGQLLFAYDVAAAAVHAQQQARGLSWPSGPSGSKPKRAGT